MTNPTLIEILQQSADVFQLALRAIIKRQNLRTPLSLKEPHPPLTQQDQWARIESIRESAQKQSFDLTQHHQSTKEYLHALTYTLENLKKDLAPLLSSTQKTSPQGYRRVKFRPQKSAPKKLRPKASEAA